MFLLKAARLYQDLHRKVTLTVKGEDFSFYVSVSLETPLTALTKHIRTTTGYHLIEAKADVEYTHEGKSLDYSKSLFDNGISAHDVLEVAARREGKAIIHRQRRNAGCCCGRKTPSSENDKQKREEKEKQEVLDPQFWDKLLTLLGASIIFMYVVCFFIITGLSLFDFVSRKAPGAAQY